MRSRNSAARSVTSGLCRAFSPCCTRGTAGWAIRTYGRYPLALDAWADSGEVEAFSYVSRLGWHRIASAVFGGLCRAGRPTYYAGTPDLLYVQRLEALAQHGLAVEAEPAVQERGVDAAEIGVELGAAVSQVFEAGMGAD